MVSPVVLKPDELIVARKPHLDLPTIPSKAQRSHDTKGVDARDYRCELIDCLHWQIERCRKVVGEMRSQGVESAEMAAIEEDIAEGENAIASDDVARMLRAWAWLEGDGVSCEVRGT